MGNIAFEHTRIVASEGGESMAEFQPDPFLTSLACPSTSNAPTTRTATRSWTHPRRRSRARGSRILGRKSKPTPKRSGIASSANTPAKIGGGHVPGKVRARAQRSAR